MTTEDIQTIARIIANQNFALLEARAAAIAKMQEMQMWSGNADLRREHAITLEQTDQYHRARAAQVAQA